MPYAVSEEWIKFAICPICGKENKMDLKTGKIIQKCEHFVKSNTKQAFFEGKERR